MRFVFNARTGTLHSSEA